MSPPPVELPGDPVIRLGLETIRALLRRLGEPQRGLALVLVAGTNGKGSTAALLAAMASAAGYRTGLVTSPHLESLEECLRLDGRAVGPGQLGELLAEVEVAAATPPALEATTFEALTAAAYLFLARQRVELAVMEVGLGGRDDATNAGDPILSVVTSISLDHAEHLGTDLVAVARSKAGVLRPGRPAVAWPGGTAAAAVLQREAARLGAELTLAPEVVTRLTGRPRAGGGQGVELATPRGHRSLELALAGEHQRRNLALAVLAAEILAARGFGRLDATAVAAGAAACRWPGRLEEVPLPGGRRLLLDAAHNPGGVAALTRHLDARGQAFQLLFGVLADKDATAMLPPLARRARRTLLTSVPAPRGRDAAELAPLAPAERVVIAAQLEEALDAALEGPPEGAGGLTVVCGSLRLVGAVRQLLRRRYGVPAPAADPLFTLP